MLDGEFEPESLEGYLAVLGLAPAFRSLGGNTSRLMHENHRGLHLVAVLTAGS